MGVKFLPLSSSSGTSDINAIYRDGSQSPTADIPFNGFSIVDVLSVSGLSVSGGSLSLSSTAHATKGVIQITDTSMFTTGTAASSVISTPGYTSNGIASFWIANTVAPIGLLFSRVSNNSGNANAGIAFSSTRGSYATPALKLDGDAIGYTGYYTYLNTTILDQRVGHHKLLVAEATPSATQFGTTHQFQFTQRGSLNRLSTEFRSEGLTVLGNGPKDASTYLDLCIGTDGGGDLGRYNGGGPLLRFNVGYFASRLAIGDSLTNITTRTPTICLNNAATIGFEDSVGTGEVLLSVHSDDNFHFSSSLVAAGYFEMVQQITPANPPALSNKLYFKSDDNLYMLDSSGIELRISGGALPTTFAMVDNQAAAADVVTFLTASYTSVQLNYSISRGAGNTESGQIFLTSDTAASAAGIAQSFASIGASGVTFTADTTGGTTLRLRYTSTSTGTAPSMRYTIKKWLA